MLSSPESSLPISVPRLQRQFCHLVFQKPLSQRSSPISQPRILLLLLPYLVLTSRSSERELEGSIWRTALDSDTSGLLRVVSLSLRLFVNSFLMPCIFLKKSSADVFRIGALFLVDPVKEFNMHIDAPAEKDEDLYSTS